MQLGTIGLTYGRMRRVLALPRPSAASVASLQVPGGRRSPLSLFHWQVDAEAAFVRPSRASAAPRRQAGAGANCVAASWSLRLAHATIGLRADTSIGAVERNPQLGLDAVVDCVGDRPELRSALRGVCEWRSTPRAATESRFVPRRPRALVALSRPPRLRPRQFLPAFAWSKNDRVMLLQPWLMLRGTWLQPRLAVRLRRHADDIEVEIRCLGVTHWDWQSQLAKEVELAGLQLNAWCTW